MTRSIAVLVLLLLTGCFRSLHPVYQASDVIFDVSLLGEWVAESETWKVTRAQGNKYRIVHADKDGRSGVLEGHLFRIGTSLFVDLLPVQVDERSSDFHRHHLLPTHTFFQVLRTRPTPQFASLNEEWFRAHLRQNARALQHVTIGDQIIITASTLDIQAFLVRHVDTEGAFEPIPAWQPDSR